LRATGEDGASRSVAVRASVVAMKRITTVE
jgi:hypothetical protein